MIHHATSELEIINAPRVHQLQNGNDQIAMQCVADADIILHQPLSDRFGALESRKMREAFPEKRFVSFPSIFFGGVFPQLVYLRLPQGGTLKGPLSDYHDSRILNSYLQNETIEQCIERMSTTTTEDIDHYEAALKESVSRDDGVDLPIMDVILEELTSGPTLYTFNHPNNRVLWSVVERALNLVGITPKIDYSMLPEKQYLGQTRAMIPDGIPEHLGFDWRRKDYELDGEVLQKSSLIQGFYDLYSQVQNFNEIVRFNMSRFNLAVNVPD